MPQTLVVGTIFIGIIFILSALIWFIYYSYQKSIDNSYTKASDKDLIMAIMNQPDKIINKDLLVREFGLSKTEARNRLSVLQHNGLLKVMYTSSMTSFFYGLNKEVEELPNIELSDRPYMTLEDILAIFKYFDFKVTLQDLILATGLPIKILKREMKYFKKEKIVKNLLEANGSTGTFRTTYLLEEPYRSNHAAFLNLENAKMHLEKVYQKVDKRDLV